MADIQINATGGDVPEQTFIQIRRGSTATDSPPVEDDVEQFSAHEREELTETGISREGRPIVPSSGYEDPLHYEDPVMHISGTGHWFLEGWIGDHSVEFLVDSGSSVTAMSDIFYRNLVHAGAPVGALQITARTLRMDCCLHRVELHCNCTGEIQPCQVVFLQWAIHQYRHIQRLFCTAPSGLLVAVHCHLAACWRD